MIGKNCLCSSDIKGSIILVNVIVHKYFQCLKIFATAYYIKFVVIQIKRIIDIKDVKIIFLYKKITLIYLEN